MTTHYSIRIVGVHYAANPTYTMQMGTVPEMEAHTVDVLRELDQKRPRVMLEPDPDNSADPHAVMARAAGRRIGYVEKVDQEIFFKLLKKNGKRFLLATIDKVEVEERGKLYISLESEPIADTDEPLWEECQWPVWPADRPLLPAKEVWLARHEAERMMDEVLWPCHDTQTADELEYYLDVWMENSLYDISAETLRTCQRLIERFQSHPDPRINAWTRRLEKFRTAFYGAKRDSYRMEWWASIIDSDAMDLLWRKWLHHLSYHLRRGLKETDDYLRLLPDQLYSSIGSPGHLFKALFYRNVPRHTLWGIYTALLLRTRTCRELGIAMKPLPEDSCEYGDLSASAMGITADTLPAELRTSLADSLHERLMDNGLMDEDWQPVGLSNAQRGLLASYLSDKLGIANQWKVFSTLWGMKTESLRSAYNKALEQSKSLTFQDRLKKVVG